MSLQAQYDEYQTTIRSLSERLNSIGMQIAEHEVVIETLKSVPEDRKAWKMFSGGESQENPVGSALVETNAKGASEQLQKVMAGLNEVAAKTEKDLNGLKSEFEEWKKSNNIKIVRG